MRVVGIYTDELDRVRVEYEDEKGDRHIGPASADDAVCDFCMAPRPRWAYPAGLVEIDHHPSISRTSDPWAACDRCHDLIEAGAVDALANHVYETQRTIVAGNPRVVMPPMDDVLQGFLDLFARFSAARTGPPVYVGGDR